MISASSLLRKCWRDSLHWLRKISFDDRGSQIFEFAVSLPLIAFFIIGILDFSQAYNVKRNLINAAREGARIGSNQPTQDLSLAEPPTVDSIALAIGQYLQTVGLKDCGLANTGGATVAGSGTLAWTYTGTTCSNEPVITIERGMLTTITTSSPYGTAQTMQVENTRVTVQYPYTWKFAGIANLVTPGTNFVGPTNLQAVAVMQNLN